MSDEKIKITVYKKWLDEDKDEIEHKLAYLILENVIFCNNGWWYEKEGKTWPQDAITMHVNCNDIFAWGCADAEDITYKEIHELCKMYRKDPNMGAAAWCIKKRKQMPQAPVEKMFRNAGIWDLEELLKG